MQDCDKPSRSVAHVGASGVLRQSRAAMPSVSKCDSPCGKLTCGNSSAKLEAFRHACIHHVCIPIHNMYIKIHACLAEMGSPPLAAGFQTRGPARGGSPITARALNETMMALFGVGGSGGSH